MTKFEKIQVGQTAEIEHTITQKDVEKFIELTGDDNRLHNDIEFSRTTELKKPVAHGMLSASFISTIIGTKIPGDGALWYYQSLEFLIPVRVGDKLLITAKVISKNERLNSIELKTDIINQDNKKVISGTSKVKVIEILPKKENKKIESSEKKVALIIGASGGIGSSTALELASEGFDIALHYNSNVSGVEEIQKKIGNSQSLIFKADIFNNKQINSLIEDVYNRFGRIDVLINCATSKLINNSFEETDFSDYQKQFDVNIKSNYLLVKAVLPYMKKNNFGKIIFINSLFSENVPPKGWSSYVTAKSALTGLMKSLSIELSQYNICVNAVSPGMTETDLLIGIPEKAKLLLKAKIPLARLASTKDVSNAIAFLVSNKSSYITGETLRINGGQSML